MTPKLRRPALVGYADRLTQLDEREAGVKYELGYKTTAGMQWRLDRGSHASPGPDGDTCINEAALLAAGYPHKRVLHVHSMPSCFSRPICHLAMVLNDQATDADRQRLLPYASRLACAGSPEIERQRADYIDQRMGWQDTWSLARQLWPPLPGAAFEHSRPAVSFDFGLAVLDGAIAIGCQASVLSAEDVQVRLAQVRKAPQGGAPRSTAHPLSRVKNWLRWHRSNCDA